MTLIVGAQRTEKTIIIIIIVKKVKVSHSLIAVGAVGVRVPLYLGHTLSTQFKVILSFSAPPPVQYGQQAGSK